MASFSRVRLDLDEAEFLRQMLLDEQRRRIGRKIAARELGDEEELLAQKWELHTIKRLIQETERAIGEIDV